MRRHVSFSLLALAVVVACGSESSTFGPGSSSGDTPPADTNQPPPPLIGGDSGADQPCASNVLCGVAATCCAQGEECVEGACLAGCASGVRCGTTCCATGEVCLAQACVAPGAACLDSFDCEENEFCEPTLGKCLPQPPEAGLCQYKPPVLPLAPKLEWSWTGSTIAHAEYDQVINTPIVIDLDGDKIPEVVIVTSKGGPGNDTDFSHTDPAFLRVLDGKTGLEKWGANVDAYKDGSNAQPDYRVNPRGTPAAGDLDGDGTIEIVVPRRTGGLLAFRADGSFLWRSTGVDGTTPYDPVFGSVTVALADMDNDGKAEVVAGGIIFDHTGKLVSDAHLSHEKWGSNDASYGPVSIIADVDGDPATTEQHLVTGTPSRSPSC